MNFEELPKETFLHILGYLHPMERVRAKGVSKLWYEMCTLAIQTHPVSLDFFRNLKTISEFEFRRLLQLCHHRIEDVQFDFQCGEMFNFPTDRIRQLLSIMVEFNYPKLKKLLILRPKPNCADSFLPLICNAPNLKMLNMTGDFGEDLITRVPGESCSMLEKLYIDSVGTSFITSSTFRFLGERCKNLKSLIGEWEFRMSNDGGGQAEVEDLNYFFGECSQLRHLCYHDTDIFDRVTNFWKLRMLESIRFDQYDVDDEFLRSLCGSFPVLSQLSISLGPNVTAPGVAYLRHMQNLKKLAMISLSHTPLVLEDEFDTLVYNLDGLKYLLLIEIFTDAARLKEAAVIFGDKDAFLYVGISDTVENVTSVFEHLLNAGMRFECSRLDDVHGNVPYDHDSMSSLMSDLNSLEANSTIMLTWRN